MPPRSRMWNGAVGSSWNADRNTVNVNPHITKKRRSEQAIARAGIDPESVARRARRPGPGRSGRLLRLQRNNRIDARGPPCRHDAGQQRNQRQRDRDEEERHRIAWRHSVSRLRISRAAAAAETRPMPEPSSASDRPLPSTIRSTWARPAPIATRMPISRVRRLTRYDSTP